MGNKWEIEVWCEIDQNDSRYFDPRYYEGGTPRYEYRDYWRGESCIAAIWHFMQAKHEGYGCVTLHWR